ncbi:MAG: NERD domain-containing protein [Ruminococcaceae bacterium]|nr:NERD domain-containing protein [Oscillospiraceae bacterium]
MPAEAILIAGIFLGVFLIVLGAFIYYLYKEGKTRREISHFGDQAEKSVSEYIKKNFPDAQVFDDVYLKTSRGLSQIDHILVCRWGVYVIETKSHNGLILTQNREWVQKTKNKTVRFYNPLKQNATHCMALRNIINTQAALKDIYVNGIVVFTSKSVRITGNNKGVIRLDQLNDYIKTGDNLAFGERRKKHVPLTAKQGRRYLDRSAIKAITRVILSNCETNPVKKHLHRERIRDYRIYKNRRPH